MPRQSIKNVSRAEIIKMRISGGPVRVEEKEKSATKRDEEGRCMMREPGRVIERERESGWLEVGEGSTDV